MCGSKRYALLDNEDAEKWSGHEKYYQQLMEPDAQWEVFRCFNGELPSLDGINRFNGMFLSGSHYSVTDDLAWIRQLEQWLKNAIQNDATAVRIVGVCFGAQVMASALGGTVGKNPTSKFCLTVERMCPTAALRNRSDFKAAFPDDTVDMKVVESHGDQVLQLPPGATLLADSLTACVEMWCYEDRALAIQGHPELTCHDVMEKIYPAVVSKGLLDEDAAASSHHSLTNDVPDSAAIINMVKCFFANRRTEVVSELPHADNTDEQQHQAVESNEQHHQAVESHEQQHQAVESDVRLADALSDAGVHDPGADTKAQQATEEQDVLLLGVQTTTHQHSMSSTGNRSLGPSPIPPPECVHLDEASALSPTVDDPSVAQLVGELDVYSERLRKVEGADEVQARVGVSVGAGRAGEGDGAEDGETTGVTADGMGQSGSDEVAGTGHATDRVNKEGGGGGGLATAAASLWNSFPSLRYRNSGHLQPPTSEPNADKPSTDTPLPSTSIPSDPQFSTNDDTSTLPAGTSFWQKMPSINLLGQQPQTTATTTTSEASDPELPVSVVPRLFSGDSFVRALIPGMGLSRTQPSGPSGGDVASRSPLKDVEEKHEDLSQLARQVTHHAGRAIECEVKLAGQDFSTIACMNGVVANKYRELQAYAAGMKAFVQALQTKREEIEPLLAQTHKLECHLQQLESVVQRLDVDTRELCESMGIMDPSLL